MTLKVDIKTSEDIEFMGAIVFAPASNFSDGPDTGFRPAMSFVLIELSNKVHASGMFNITDEGPQDAPGKAVAIAADYLWGENCICEAAIKYILEKYAAEV
ncbi:MAG: hypothetical protein ACYTBJ_26725 [Planctomycetota bacterium]|jgi:hypothetical protein